MIFDAPLVKGNFQARLKAIEAELAKKPNATVLLCQQTKCKSKEHLIELMDTILAGKGEGVMIKDPKSKYEGVRSYSLLKVKRF